MDRPAQLRAASASFRLELCFCFGVVRIIGQAKSRRAPIGRHHCPEHQGASTAIPVGGRVQPGPADNQCHDVPDPNTGESIASRMLAATGMRWTRADKSPGSRVNGAAAIVGRLRASLQSPLERQALFIGAGCRNVIRTLPILPASPTIDGDVDTDSEDHAWDAMRYRIFAKPQEIKRRRVTLN